MMNMTRHLIHDVEKARTQYLAVITSIGELQAIWKPAHDVCGI